MNAKDQIFSIKTPNHHFAYMETGHPKGKAIVMIHGYPGRPQDFRWLFEYLQNYRILSLAMPNLGLSTLLQPIPCTSIKDRMQALLEFLDAMNIEQCFLVGHSMGGPIILSTGRFHADRIKGLILISSVGAFPYLVFRRSKPHWGHRLLTLPFIGRFFRPFARIVFEKLGFPKGISEDSMAHVLHCASDFSFSENKDNIENIKIPTLCTWSKDDPYIENHLFEDLAERLSNKTILAFDDGGHNPQRKHPQAIAKSIENWIGMIDPASS